MQAKRTDNDTRSIMTVNITEAMIKEKSEPELLRMALNIYGLNHPLENERQGLACICKCSSGMIVKAVDGNGHLGGEAWLAIEKALGVELYQEWIKERARR